MEKFEYRTMTYEAKGAWGGKVDSELEERLNALGSQGWELVSTVATNQIGSTNSLVSIFKRKVRE